VNLMEPDVFPIESALRFARMAPERLPGPWAQVEQEIRERAARGMKHLKDHKE
jgi:hypothetical protein